MDLKVAHDLIRLFLAKERGGYETPEEIDAFLHRAQMWRFNELYEDFGKTQKLQDGLSPFSVRFTYTASGSGVVTLPTNEAADPCYLHLLSIWVQYYDNALLRTRYRDVKIVSEDELAKRLNSQIHEPTIQRPAGIESSVGNFQLYPAQALSGYGYYLKRPVPPVFAYTLLPDRRTITYNQSGSTQMIWNDAEMNNILIKAIQLAGVNLKDTDIVQFTEAKNQQNI